ncbi:MAG TPA: type II toxin-antitoxin system VapC family toxin [Solirubrobacteraceae bacterium]
MASTVVVDAWAVLALLDDEPAASRVERVLIDHDAVMSWINLGEVFYTAIRRRGEERALKAMRTVRKRVKVEEINSALVLAASRIKAGNRLSYADAFCVATAQRHRAPLYTGDPEILAFAGDLKVVDLRSAL